MQKVCKIFCVCHTLTIVHAGSQWTMKRYLYALCKKFHCPVRDNHTALKMGALLDLRLSGGANVRPKSPSGKKMRWTAKKDSARLLGCMFGTLAMRQLYVLSTQPLTRQQIDNRLSKTPQQRYWHDVAKLFNDSTFAAPITVHDLQVQQYLCENLSSDHRLKTTAANLQQQWTSIR